MKTTISFIAFILFSFTSTAQNFKWAKNMGGTQENEVNAMVRDGAGNIYQTGHFSGTTDFDPGPATNNLTSLGWDDNFVTKLDPGGNLIWAKSFGGTSWDDAKGLAVDASGNVFISGTFSETVDFDPGTGKKEIKSIGFIDGFILKLDASGNFGWVKTYGGFGSYVYGTILALDQSGNIYTSGSFKGTVNFDPGAGTTNRTPKGDRDVFVLKLTPNGDFSWATNIGGDAKDEPISITVDPTNKLLVTGFFNGTTDFDPGTGTDTHISKGSDDIFIVKLDAAGAWIWAKTFGGSASDQGRCIKTDSLGNIFTIGSFQGTVDFDPGTGITELVSNGSLDIFISKLDGNGNLVWAKRMGGSGMDIGLAISITNKGYVYATGAFSSTVDFDPGTGTTSLVSNGTWDVFILALNPSGNFVWAKSFGGPVADYGLSVIADKDGSVYSCGTFGDITDFDPGTGVFNITPKGVSDVFLSKLGPGTSSVNEIISRETFVFYPNPSNGFIHIQTPNIFLKQPFYLFDYCGRQVVAGYLNYPETIVNLETLKSGIYFLEAGGCMKKVIKE